MSDIKEKPADPFASIDLEEFKEPTIRTNTDKPQIDKEVIREVAEKNDFTSRQPKPKRPEAIRKTSTLFREDCAVIEKSIRGYSEFFKDDYKHPSESDVIRAALHVLDKVPGHEKFPLIRELRGKDRK